MTMLAPCSIADEVMILDVSDGSQINVVVLLERLAKADVVMLGEQHDRAEHHYIQAMIISSLLEAGQRPALFFEMLSEREEKRHQHFRSDSSQHGLPVPSLEHDRAREKVLEWELRGWPIWSAYAPLFRLADLHELPVLHANIAVELMHNIRRFGLLAIPRSLREQLFPEQSSAELKILVERLIPRLRQAHGLSENDPTIVGLVAAQLARDAYMAWRLAQGKSPAVLIAGSEHVRLDLGAAAHLKAFKPDKKVASIAFLDYRKGWNTVERYGALFQLARPPFDYIWLVSSSVN